MKKKCGKNADRIWKRPNECNFIVLCKPALSSVEWSNQRIQPHTMLKHFSVPNLRRKHLANSHVSLRFKICHQDVSACIASTQHLSNFRLQAWSSTDRHDIRFQSFTPRIFPVVIFYPNLATNGSSEVEPKSRFLECISHQKTRRTVLELFYISL